MVATPDIITELLRLLTAVFAGGAMFSSFGNRQKLQTIHLELNGKLKKKLDAFEKKLSGPEETRQT